MEPCHQPKANGSAMSYVLGPYPGLRRRRLPDERQGRLTGVKALDDYTLQVTLRYPFAEFPETLGHSVAAVAPVDYINKIGEKALARSPSAPARTC